MNKIELAQYTVCVLVLGLVVRDLIDAPLALIVTLGVLIVAALFVVKGKARVK